MINSFVLLQHLASRSLEQSCLLHLLERLCEHDESEAFTSKRSPVFEELFHSDFMHCPSHDSVTLLSLLAVLTIQLECFDHFGSLLPLIVIFKLAKEHVPKLALRSVKLPRAETFRDDAQVVSVSHRVINRAAS